jgi:4-carboxymuconolactone decarboxylase
MTDHLPSVYVDFRSRFPGVTKALDGTAAAVDAAGPLDERTKRLVKLGVAVGDLAEGAVRSNVRKALAAGVTLEEIEQVVLLALTTRGFPAVVAAWGWVREVVEAR